MTGMKFNGVQSDVEEFALALLVRTISTLDEQQPAQAPTCAPRNAPDCKRRQKSKLTVELLSIGCLSQDGLAVECSQGGNKGLVTTLETKRPGLKLFAMKTADVITCLAHDMGRGRKHEARWLHGLSTCRDSNQYRSTPLD